MLPEIFYVRMILWRRTPSEPPPTPEDSTLVEIGVFECQRSQKTCISPHNKLVWMKGPNSFEVPTFLSREGLFRQVGLFPEEKKQLVR